MKKRTDTAIFTTLLGAITALAALSIDMSLPALPEMTSALSAPNAAGHWTVSVFLTGFAGGQLFLGPLSDRVGRRPVLLTGLAFYIAAGIGCTLAPTIFLLLGLRFLQGLSACAGAVVARAIIRDVFDRQVAAAKQSMLTVVTTMAMLIAPIVGAWVLRYTGWRGVFGLLPIAGAAVFVAAHVVIPETKPAAVEGRVGALRSYGLVLRQPVTVGNAFVAAFIFGGLFAFIADSPTVIIRTFGVSPQAFSWMFAVVAFGQLCGSALNRYLAVRVKPGRLIRVGGGFTVLGTVSVALCAAVPSQVVWLLLAVALYAFALGMTNPNAIAAAMMPLPEYAGAASALIGFLYFTMASCGASLSGYLFPGTVHGMLTVIAAFGAAGLSVLIALEVYQAQRVRGEGMYREDNPAVYEADGSGK